MNESIIIMSQLKKVLFDHSFVLKYGQFYHVYQLKLVLKYLCAFRIYRGTCTHRCVIFITRVSEVIMFSPCVFVCLCVSMFVMMFVGTI